MRSMNKKIFDMGDFLEQLFLRPFRLRSKRSKLVKLEIDGGKQSSSLSERINCRSA